MVPGGEEALRRGARLGDVTVLRSVRVGRRAGVLQGRRDCGDLVAVKVMPVDEAARLDAEATRLSRLTGAPVPRVLGQGTAAQSSYLTLDWRWGVDVRRVADELRLAAGPAAIRDLCVTVVRALAAVHLRGIVHGQVHPRHVVVDADGAVSLLDLSHARADLGHLSAPAVARRWLDGAPQMVPAVADEQYSVAALVFLLLTGQAPFGITRGRRALAECIVNGPVPVVTDVDGRLGPELGSAVRCAMSATPERRFASVAEFADALAGARILQRGSVVGSMGSGALNDHLSSFLQAANVDIRLEDKPMPRTPTCSVNYGAAGVAYALHRIGRATEDPRVLAAADRWLQAAERHRADPDAFYDSEFRPDVFGRVSPYHTASGIAVVGALMARAAGDSQAHRGWLTAFQDRINERTVNPDLTLGRSSIVVGASHAVAGADPAWPEVSRLAGRVAGLLTGIWEDVEKSPPRYLGIAHGSAGILYASLLWSRASGWRPPPALRESLSLLAGQAEADARGVCWPVLQPTDEPAMYVSGWCNGAAGQVMLWTLAHAVLGDERWRRLALGAAWGVVDAPVGVSSLCCGAAGEIYALLSAFRCTGDDEWLARASARAAQAARDAVLAADATSPLSLYKGHTGLALLAVELERPELSAMPLFEIEAL